MTLDEMYKQRDILNLNIHVLKHKLVAIRPCQYAAEEETFQLMRKLSSMLPDYCTLLWYLGEKIVFYILKDSRPVKVQGRIKYWELSDRGITAAIQHCEAI